MADVNECIFIGRLVRDPELKFTPAGIPLAEIGIAINRRVKAGADKQTDFLDCKLWRQNAEFAAAHLTKGDSVYVRARAEKQTWVAPDGTKRSAMEFIVEDLQALSAKRPGTGGEAGSAPAGSPSAPSIPGAPDTSFDDNDAPLVDPFAEF